MACERGTKHLLLRSRWRSRLGSILWHPFYTSCAASQPPESCRLDAGLQIAKRQAVVNPENTFFSVKRFIGRKMDEVKDESKQVPYRVITDSSGNVKIASAHAGKEFAPEEISALVLRKLTDDAAKFLGDKVSFCCCL